MTMGLAVGIGLFVIVLVVAVWFARAAGRQASERRLTGAVGAAPAERLITYEMSRDPAMTRSEAARRALERLEADRSR